MQCPECHYITFTTLKKCENCNYDFKHLKALHRNPAFTIHEGAPMVAEAVAVGFEEGTETYTASEETVAPDNTAIPATPSGDFNLDLSDAMAMGGQAGAGTTEDLSEEDPQPIESFESLEFDPDAELEMGDLEVEGLGFEDLGIGTADEEETTEISLENIVEPEVTGGEATVDLAPEPEIDIAEPAVELKPEPEIDIAEPAVELEPEPEIDAGEFAVELEPEPEIDIAEPAGPEESVELDLDMTETEAALAVEPEASDIVLDFEETTADNESPPPPEPTPAPETDEFEIKLEIDTSDAPLSGESTKKPKVEIEDLGLTLESDDKKD